MAYVDNVTNDNPAGPPVPRIVGAISDLYPRAASLQRIANAEAFALLSVRAATAISPGQHTVLLESGSEAPAAALDEMLSLHRPTLLSHLWKSPVPLYFDARTIRPLAPADSAAALSVSDGGAPFGMAFPVHLGAMGNGYTALFGIRTEVTADFCIDLHRKSVTLLREVLKLEFSSLATGDVLSDREIECLQLVGDGLKSEAIGARLKLSVHTVNAYLSSATSKLDAVNRIQAIAKAIRLGLIG
ncbi:helix-turn-helix transcriptional regulator [Pseudohoeflea coraliihabitans]|uniref:Helix-turn-helix transcriptional regulator n=1 Tax=Pseudohoeflea coraliihabitans TaxID=2860393 RepID=A0ABS6WNQ0_9HYPH|nr:helix-turn-helix transcriptional regulator [Pseudohoeflea sp. DP4N28-3]MBW3097385.1 helix-turn-helix transcriptional regulator [Pseudohoeflea sp. DP4N28-3]